MQSYTIFYNNARLRIANSEHNYQTENCTENCFEVKNIFPIRHSELVSESPANGGIAGQARNDGGRDVFTKILKNFLSSEQNIDLLYATESEEQQLKKAISDFFILKRAAGGVVFKDDALLSIFRFDRWDFPKGHIENGELATDAALREVTEETGIDQLIIEKDLGYTYHIFKNENDNFILKETHWFGMRTASEKELVPQTEEAISAVKWIPFSQRNRIIENTYPAIAELLDRVTTKT